MNKNLKIIHQMNFFYKFLFILQSIIIIQPLLLNNIILLGEEEFRYSRFSFNSNGDMFVDTSTFPVNNQRNFFGLKKNGRFYFNDTNNKPTGYYSMEIDHEKGRLEGESYFIKLTSNNSEYHGRELMIGISKNKDDDSGFYTEIYNFNNNNFTKYLTKNIFGNIIASSFTIIKNPDESDSCYYYTSAFIIKNGYYYKLIIKKTYFSFDITAGYNHVINKEITCKLSRIVSSFYTEKLVFICLYMNEDNRLCIRAYNSDFSQSNITSINNAYNYADFIFYKGIHLKGEIGIFIYFKQNINYPTIQILQCNENKLLTSYSNFREINLNKTKFQKSDSLNDIVRLNDFQICYISVNIDKTSFIFVVLTLYKSDTLINIKYYQIEMFNTYRKKIFLTLKASLYNNFLALSFSHCPQQSCSSAYTDKHYQKSLQILIIAGELLSALAHLQMWSRLKEHYNLSLFCSTVQHHYFQDHPFC